MISGLVSFEEIVEAVKDETGISNLRNIYPRIRRFIYRAERDIGFGGTLLLKKKVYTPSNGGLIYHGDSWKIKLPDDFLYLEEFGMCQEGLCPGQYQIQGNWVFINGRRDSVTILYYTLVCDGEGNPLVSENHFEAVVAGIVYGLYKPRRFQDKGGIQAYRDYQDFYHERIREARGDDNMPNTSNEWSKIGGLMKMSSSDALIYLESRRCFETMSNVGLNTSEPMPGGKSFYFFQFDDVSKNIDTAQSLDSTFLERETFIPENEAYEGKIFILNKVGRFGFALKNIDPDTYIIQDILGINVTENIFDTYYDGDTRTQFYITKSIFSYGELYFKFIYNG